MHALDKYKARLEAAEEAAGWHKFHDLESVVRDLLLLITELGFQLEDADYEAATARHLAAKLERAPGRLMSLSARLAAKVRAYEQALEEVEEHGLDDDPAAWASSVRARAAAAEVLAGAPA